MQKTTRLQLGRELIEAVRFTRRLGVIATNPRVAFKFAELI